MNLSSKTNQICVITLMIITNLYFFSLSSCSKEESIEELYNNETESTRNQEMTDREVKLLVMNNIDDFNLSDVVITIEGHIYQVGTINSLDHQFVNIFLPEIDKELTLECSLVSKSGDVIFNGLKAQKEVSNKTNLTTLNVTPVMLGLNAITFSAVVSDTEYE